MSQTKSLRTRLVGFGFAVLMAVGGYAFATDCNTYSNSRIQYFNGEAYCGGFGSGCTECTNSGGGACVTNGSFCKPMEEHQH